ncbi:hypothetical protein [Geitlerinema sp. PCC 9228]|uniref:hypothetical protein n=1 Tax=Geitlerinema sp. PCC 9228 TaxID=111611 RepID=UPI00147E733D|nr:hypothetical protein [Geitlerinema sp. PCC 9228]
MLGEDRLRRAATVVSWYLVDPVQRWSGSDRYFRFWLAVVSTKIALAGSQVAALGQPAI